MNKHKKRIHTGGCILSVLYLAGLLYFLFFSESYGRMQGQNYQYNLMPFREIRRFWLYRNQIGSLSVFINLFGNVIAFIPFGFFLPIITKKRVSFPAAVLLTFVFSLTVECIQLVTKVGCFDVDDLILNTIGGFIGAAIFSVADAIRRCLHR